MKRLWLLFMIATCIAMCIWSSLRFAQSFRPAYFACSLLDLVLATLLVLSLVSTTTVRNES